MNNKINDCAQIYKDTTNDCLQPNYENTTNDCTKPNYMGLSETAFSNLITKAIMSKDLDTLKKIVDETYSTWPMDLVACHGFLELVEFLHSIGAKASLGTMNSAIENGHTETVKFLHSVGYKCSKDAIDMAIRYGDLALVEFLHSIGCSYTDDSFCLGLLSGNIEVARFVYSTGAKLKVGPYTSKILKM
jgi:hypothetical protein